MRSYQRSVPSKENENLDTEIHTGGTGRAREQKLQFCYPRLGTPKTVSNLQRQEDAKKVLSQTLHGKNNPSDNLIQTSSLQNHKKFIYVILRHQVHGPLHGSLRKITHSSISFPGSFSLPNPHQLPWKPTLFSPTFKENNSGFLAPPTNSGPPFAYPQAHTLPYQRRQPHTISFSPALGRLFKG